MTAPIPLILHCPECRTRHIDENDFATRSHATHACQKCGLVWRPAIEPTVGVQFLPGFKNAAPAPLFVDRSNDRVGWPGFAPEPKRSAHDYRMYLTPPEASVTEKKEPVATFIVFIDFEATGLDPVKATPLELGARMVHFNATLTDTGNPFTEVWPLPHNFATLCDPLVIKMHTLNGLFADCLSHGDAEVGSLFGSWVLKTIRDEMVAPRYGCATSTELFDYIKADEIRVHLGGKNVERYDRVMLKRIAPDIESVFSHRVFDVQLLRLLDRATGQKRFSVDAYESKHRALDDVKDDIRLARTALEWMQK